MHSILSKYFLDMILVGAKENLLADGCVSQVVFTNDQYGRHISFPIQLPKLPPEKQAYMVGYGSALRESGIFVREVVLLAEGWFVNATKVPSAMSIPPSQHPARQEAITLFGRNADGYRTSSVVQLFTRDRNNKPVSGAVAIAIYNQQMSKRNRVESLLDYLFIGQRR